MLAFVDIFFIDDLRYIYINMIDDEGCIFFINNVYNLILEISCKMIF